MTTLEEARAHAVELHPEAAPFADLLLGGDAVEVIANAKAVADAVKASGLRPATAAQHPVAPAAAPVGNQGQTPAAGTEEPVRHGYQPPGHETYDPMTVTLEDVERMKRMGNRNGAFQALLDVKKREAYGVAPDGSVRFPETHAGTR